MKIIASICLALGVFFTFVTISLFINYAVTAYVMVQEHVKGNINMYNALFFAGVASLFWGLFVFFV